MGLYVKTLNSALGPVQMNCFVFDDTCDSRNIDKYITSDNKCCGGKKNMLRRYRVTKLEWMQVLLSIGCPLDIWAEKGKKS